MDKIKEKIFAEFENIEKILKDIEELLLKENLTKHEINSSAYLLINFYNGIENILKQILKSLDMTINNTSNWHKELLDKSKSNNLISKKLYDTFIEYMKFRHYAIHNYTFSLKKDLFWNLLEEVLNVYEAFKNKINR